MLKSGIYLHIFRRGALGDKCVGLGKIDLLDNHIIVSGIIPIYAVLLI